MAVPELLVLREALWLAYSQYPANLACNTNRLLTVCTTKITEGLGDFRSYELS